MTDPHSQADSGEQVPVIRLSPAMSWLLGLAAFVIIVAGMKAAQELIVPFLASLFLTVICYPALEWLQKKRLSTWVALFIIILVVSSVLLLVVLIVGASLQDLSGNIDEYSHKLEDRRMAIILWIEKEGYPELADKLKPAPVAIDSRLHESRPLDSNNSEELRESIAPTTEEPTTEEPTTEEPTTEEPTTEEPTTEEPFSDRIRSENRIVPEQSATRKGVALLRSFLADLAGLFGDIFWVLLIMVFMLMEASTFPQKISRMSSNNPHRSAQAEQIRNAIWQYATLKTLISMMVGGGVVILLKLLKVDYAFLWGLIAFFFNFIPNVGSFIAAIPGVGMAVIQHDVTTGIYATIGYAFINLIFSNIVEPRVMGKGMGISALVVFLSLIFWGWVLGPVGMILSVPLTMIVKIVLDSSDQTRWFSVLLSGESPGSEQVPSGK
ncbi:MAG: AI-2E family transporter [Planctomycetaceae bacterium]|nr:AI-2E family transporter [Planctomycetaceae bacterium]